MRFTIEKGVPVPPVNDHRKSCYPFEDMEVGDSFFVPCEGKSLKRFRVVVSQRNTKLRRAGVKGRFFTVRSVEGGVRCWCVASR